jgi:Flp pilus assembly pilin Flp
MLKDVLSFLKDETGATMIEYALVVAGVATIAGTMFADDGIVSNTLSTKITNAMTKTGA